MNINWIKITRIGAAATTPETASGIEEEKPIDVAFNVYPNPVSETLFFTKDVSGGKLSVVDSQTGNIVLSQKINDNSLNVSNLRQGIYFVVFEKDGEKTIKRFIKK